MDLKITNEKQNPLFSRKEIEAVITSDTAPSNQDVAKMIADKYSVEPNAIKILGINGKFGSKEFSINANVYSNQKERDSVELITKKEKEAEAKAAEPALAEQPAEAEAPAAPATEEKPAPAEETKTPAEEAIGLNPVEEAKAAEEKKAEEDKKEKDKTEEEKQLEK